MHHQLDMVKFSAMAAQLQAVPKSNLLMNKISIC